MANEAINLFELQKEIVKAVRADAVFNQKVIDLLGGKPLTYAIDINEIDGTETYPILIVHKNTNIDDTEQGKQAMIQFIFGAMLGKTSIDTDGTLFYASIRDIEILSRDVLDIVKRVVCTKTGYNLEHWNMLVTTIGEADDVQCVTSIRLEQLQFI